MKRAADTLVLVLVAALIGCSHGVPDSFFQIVTTSPDETVVDAPLSAEVGVTFTEGTQVFAESVTEDTFFVSDGHKKLVGTYVAVDNTVTFTPLSALARNTVYTAVLTTGVRDVTGAALEAQYTFTFRTVAALGDLDGRFSGDGVAVDTLSTGNDGIADVVMLPNDKILTGGFSFDSTNTVGLVARYLPDGTPDETFGTAGFTTIDAPVGNLTFSAIARTSDGSIVAAGTAGFEVFVARFTADGERDLSFGGGDGYYQGSTGQDDRAYDVAVADDGTIYAVGDRTGAVNHGVIYAIKPDGTGLDPTFNGGSVLAYDAGYEGNHLRAVTLDSDENLVVAGTSYWQADGLAQQIVAVLRVTPAGALDTTFAGSGASLTVLDESATAYGCTVAADGGIYAAGDSTIESATVPFVLRLLPDGTLDESFGAGGITHVDLEDASLYDIAIQENGKPVAAGYSTSATRGYDGLFVRLTTDGALDESFGPSQQGVAVVSASPDDELIFGVEVARSGRLVAGGRITTAGSSDTDLYMVGLW